MFPKRLFLFGRNTRLSAGQILIWWHQKLRSHLKKCRRAGTRNLRGNTRVLALKFLLESKGIIHKNHLYNLQIKTIVHNRPMPRKDQIPAGLVDQLNYLSSAKNVEDHTIKKFAFLCPNWMRVNNVQRAKNLFLKIVNKNGQESLSHALFLFTRGIGGWKIKKIGA